MACTVNSVTLENGQQSSLFNSLKTALGDAGALSAYLELSTNKDKYAKLYGLNKQGEVDAATYLTTPKYKLAEFQKYPYRYQSDVMDMLTQDFMEELTKETLNIKKKQKGQQFTSTVLTGVDTSVLSSDPTLLERIITRVEKNLKAEIAENQNKYTPDRLELLEIAAENVRNYIQTKDRNLGPVGLKLQHHGVFIKTDNKKTSRELLEDYNEEVDSFDSIDIEKKKLEQVRIYDLSILETSPITNILDQLKIYLKNVKKVDNKKYRRNPKRGVTPYELSVMGNARSANSSKLYAKLTAVLSGVQTIDQIPRRLETSLQANPELVPIYNDLLAEQGVVVQGIGTYKPLQVALFTLAKQDYSPLNIVEQPDGSVVIMQANSTSARSKTQNNWERTVKEQQLNPNAKLLSKEVAAYINNRGVRESLNAKATQDIGTRVYTPSKITLATLADYYNDAGFEGVTADVLDKVVKKVVANPKLLKKDLETITPYRVLHTLTHATAVKAMQGDDIFSSDWKKAEGKSIRLIAEEVAKSQPDLTSGAFRTAAGKMIHPNNIGSAAQDTFTLLTSPTNEGLRYLDDFQNDPMYENTKIMSILGDKNSEDYQNFKVHTLNALNSRGNSQEYNYGSLSTFDALVSRMNAFFNPVGNPNYMSAFTPTQGDRGNLMILQVPKMNLKEGASKGEILTPVFEGDRIQSKEIRDWTANQIQAELVRIVNTSKNNGIKNYADNGSRFMLFKELNEIIEGREIAPQDIPALVNELLPKAEKAFKDAVESDIQYYLDEEVIKRTKDGNYKPHPKFTSRYSSNSRNLTRAKLETFLANNLIYNYESMLFLVGDPAFYKNDVDINKRFALPFTPGMKLAVGQNSGMKGNQFRVKVVKEPKVTSEFAELYETITGAKGKFKQTEIADGYGIVSLDRYKQTALAMGRHTDELLEVIENLEKGKKVDPNSPSLGALKAFFFKIQNVNNVMTPVSLKYSIFPAIPSLFEAKNSDGSPKFPTLNTISKHLSEGKADEIVMESAVKVGAHKVRAVDKLDSTTGILLDNNFVRHPQVVPNDPKIENLLGSQIRKLIVANFAEDGTLFFTDPSTKEKVDLTPSRALELYNIALSSLAVDGANGVTNELFKEGIYDERALIQKFLSSTMDSTHQNFAYFQEALTTTFKGERTLPLNFPTLNFKIDNFINSAYRKAVNRAKLPGHSAVQISSFGTSDIGVASDLKFVHFSDKNGKAITGAQSMQLARDAKEYHEILGVTGKEARAQELADKLSTYKVNPSEIRLTPSYFLAKIQDIAKQTVLTDKLIKEQISDKAREMRKMSGAVGKEANRIHKAARETLVKKETEKIYKKLLRQVQTGNKLDVDKIHALGLGEVVLYRIPTQGKNSMLVGSIKEFLPEGSGNTIQVPGEIVDQAGSDFDIDKVFIEMGDFELGAEGLQRKAWDIDANAMTKEEAQAFIFEFHKSVLSSPKHIAELLLPNDVQRLRDIIDEFGLSEVSHLGNLASAKTQENFRANNSAGKNLISISSIASVMHSVSQHIKPRFLSDKMPYSLGKVKNDAGTDFISTEIAEIQNAAVDNAKEPLLGLLNINEMTASTALLLVSSGKGLRYAAAVLNAPIVREFSKVYSKWERAYGREAAMSSAVREVRNKFGLTPRQGKLEYSLDSHTENKAIALLKGASKSDHAIALEAFLDMKKAGDQLAKFQRTMNIDSKGTPASTAKLFSTYIDLANIRGTKANQRERSNESLGAEYPSVLRETGKQTFAINEEAYNNSHLSFMEVGAIHEAIDANRVISPAASKQMQGLVKRAKEKFGYLTENQQINILSQYNSYLSMNSRSTKGEPTHLSKAIESGEYAHLTDATNPNSTAELLKAHKKAVRRKELLPNDFLDQLQIIKDEKNNKQYVTFQNTTSRALAGDIKEDLMNFYSDLMFSSSDLERGLAKSLTEYAVVHYGFSTGPNSFVEFVPPKAYRNFLKGNKGESLPKFFIELQNKYDDLEHFNETFDEYLDMYLANNSHRISLPAFKDHEEYEAAWEKYLNDREYTNVAPFPEYIKIYNNEERKYIAYERVSSGEVRPVQTRGIPNFVVEYHNGDSIYNQEKSAGHIASVSEMSKTSTVNKQILENIKETGSEFEALLGPELFIEAQTFDTKAEFTSWLDKAINTIAENEYMPVKDLAGAKSIIESAVLADIARKEKGMFKEKSLDQVVKDEIRSVFETMLDANAKAIIKTLC